MYDPFPYSDELSTIIQRAAIAVGLLLLATWVVQRLMDRAKPPQEV